MWHFDLKRLRVLWMIYDDFTAETKRTLNLATNCGCLLFWMRSKSYNWPSAALYIRPCPSLESIALRRLGTGLAHFMTSKFRWLSTKDDQHSEHLWTWLVYYWQPPKKFVVPLAPHFLSQTQIVDDEKVDTTCLCPAAMFGGKDQKSNSLFQWSRLPENIYGFSMNETCGNHGDFTPFPSSKSGTVMLHDRSPLRLKKLYKGREFDPISKSWCSCLQWTTLDWLYTSWS